MVIRYRGLAGTLSYRSFHDAATWTHKEGSDRYQFRRRIRGERLDAAGVGAGYRRGERAARTFALCNRERVEVRIGLPGRPGESTDWLEIFLRDGIEAVRSGLLGAIPFVPTRDEIENSRQETIQARYTKMITETYPLPPLETLRLEYRRTRSGEIWVHKLARE